MRKQTLEETSRFFDSVAQDWELLKKDILGDFDLNRLILEIMDKCRIASDLGCGTGDLLPVLKKKADIVIGVDNSPNMLKSAKERFAKNDGFDLRIGELEHLPLKDEEADFALINMALHHLASPFEGITEAYRILKKGKKAVIVEFDKHNNETLRKKYNDRWLGFEEVELKGWLNAVGFVVKKTEFYELKKGLKAVLYLAVKDKTQPKIK